MTVIKSGDLVTLKSGGPAMTVDTVNTDILDDNKITGVLCAWFVGDKLERVRFDHRAIEPVAAPVAATVDEVVATQEDRTEVSAPKEAARVEETTGEYNAVLDEMVTAMNVAADAVMDVSRTVARKPRPARAAKHDTPAVDGVSVR